MRTCLCLLAVLACAQGGPYIWRQRPVAKPLVATAQTFVHGRLLAVEKRVLQASLDVSRLAQATTQEGYRLTDEARLSLEVLVKELQKVARRITPLNPRCVNSERLRKTVEYLNNVTEDVYLCTHALSDVAASFEVLMTEKLIAARAQVWNIREAMWFCQKYQTDVDTECLKRLVVEGLQLLDKLPERGRMVLDRAQAEGAQSLAKLGECFSRSLSAAEERQLAEMQRMRKCAQQDDDDGQ